jgi:hypothetical protein
MAGSRLGPSEITGDSQRVSRCVSKISIDLLCWVDVVEDTSMKLLAVTAFSAGNLVAFAGESTDLLTRMEDSVGRSVSLVSTPLDCVRVTAGFVLVSAVIEELLVGMSVDIVAVAADFAQDSSNLKGVSLGFVGAITDFSKGVELMGVVGDWAGMSAHMEGVTADLLAVIADLTGVIANLVGITTDLVGVTADLVGVTADLVGVTADLVGVTADLVGVTADLVGVTAYLVGVSMDLNLW